MSGQQPVAVDNVVLLRVASDSNPNSVAGSVAKNLQEGRIVEMVAVGASAVNQAVKALAIARGFVAPSGKDLYFKPGFQELMIDGAERTAIKFYVVIK